jgi:hypothetical protein
MPPHICELKSGGLQAVRGACPPDAVVFRGAGINLFDLFWCSSTGMGPVSARGCSHNESLKMLSSYRQTGLRFFRFFATDWGPRKLFWYQHPQQNWKELDQVWDAIDDSGLYVIPSIRMGGWDELANLVTPGLHEGPNDLVCNKTSVARGLAVRYFTEFVQRYKDRRSLLLWELGNELNLVTNLPPPHCSPTRMCFNTSAMVSFTTELIALIRGFDPLSRPISSGFSTNRPSAWHMEHCPYNVNVSAPCAADPGSSGFWAVDTEAQFRAQLRVSQGAVDVWSLHLYGGVQQHPPDRTKCYFDQTDCVDGTAVLAAAEAEAAAAGALLYVGEYGGVGPNFDGPTLADQAWPRKLLSAQVESARAGGVWALSTLWAWECYTHRSDMVCLWPNSTDGHGASDALIRYVQEADQRMRA